MGRLGHITLLYAFINLQQLCSTQQAYQQKAVNLHNQHRAKHHTPALQLDSQLDSAAVKCAQHYAHKKAIDHSCPHKNGAGENLASGSGGSWSNHQFAEMSTNMWYNEVKDYDYNKPGFSAKTGHFTQVVWKNSQKFGFGTCTVDGYTVGVALYSPPGNYQGQYRENVLKP